MELDIDIYFWMVDRGLFDDDQRNKVDIDRNKVKLHREHAQRFENAFYIGKIMLMFKKTIMKISKRPFTLDPGIVNLKDQITSTVKQMNWTVVVKELKKFNIKVDTEKKAKIIEGRTQHINEILQKLFDFDNNGSIQGRFQDGNMSEINYNGGNNDKSVILGNDSTNASFIDGMNNASPILLNNAKKNNLEPIILQSKKQSLAQSVVPLSETSSIRQLPQNFASVSQSVTSLNEISEEKELADAETTLEFILISLARSLQLKPKQAAGLLSNNHKYLVHIAVKGMKGSDFSKLHSWYESLYPQSKTLVRLLDNEKDQQSIKTTLTIIKCGLYSQNIDIVINCSRVLSKIGQDINSMGGELYGQAWDWLVNDQSSKVGEGLEDLSVPEFSNDLNNKSSDEQSHPLSESGLRSCLYALRKHPSTDLLDTLCPLLFHFGKKNPYELFIHHLKNVMSGNDSDKSGSYGNGSSQAYLTFIHEVMGSTSQTSLFKENVVSTGVFDEWINYALRIGDFDTQSQSNSVFDRSAALAFLADCWLLKSEKFEDPNNDIGQAILSVLKRGCRDRSKVLRIVSFELLFKILHEFSVDRNAFAPIIYKTLTFLLIEFHMDNDLREQLMRHFITLFQQVQTIPVAILCEPLLKQIQLAQQNSTLPSQISDPLSIGLPQLSYIFNLFDFEFFQVIAHHKRLSPSIALSLTDLLLSVASHNVIFSNSAIGIILEIIHKYGRDSNVIREIDGMIKDFGVKAIEENERQKVKIDNDYKKVKEQSEANSQKVQAQTKNVKGATFKSKQPQPIVDPQLDEKTQQYTISQHALKTKQKLLVNILKQLIQFGSDMLKQSIRTYLLSSYSRLEKDLKLQSKPLSYLLGLYGEDLAKMLQYAVLESKELEGDSNSVNTERLNMQIERVTQSLLYPQPEGGERTHRNGGNDSTTLSRDLQVTMVDQAQPVMTKKQKQLEKVLINLQSIKAQVLEKKDRHQLEEDIRKQKEDQLKQRAKRTIQHRQIYEHGVMPKRGIGNKSVDSVAIRQNNQNEIHVRIVKAKDDDGISEINIEEDNRMLVPYNQNQTLAVKNPVLKQLKQFQLYDIRIEEQKDQDAVRFLVKKYLKVFRALFTKYANTSGPISNNNKKTFEALQKQNSQITVAELFKFLKDFSISQVQASKDDIIQMVRRINMDILKKKGGNQSSLSILEFEGYVEFLLQLAVHLYSFDQDLPPQEHLQRLITHMRDTAIKTQSLNAKLFEDTVIVGDQKLINELNRRIANNPGYQLPDGFQKVVEKEVISVYELPKALQIKESQRVSLEVLDHVLNQIFGFHFLEPMSQVVEVAKAKPNLKAQAKDKIIHEINQNPTASNQMNMISRSRQPVGINNRLKQQSNSIDANPIRSTKNLIHAQSQNQSIKNLSMVFKSPRPSESVVSKMPLSVDLKLQVAKASPQERGQMLETAYVLEEILYAVENGLESLPAQSMQQQKPRIINKVIESKIQKQEYDLKQQHQDRIKLELRKKMLKDQLDQMRLQKETKDKELNDKKKVEQKQQALKQKQIEDKKKEALKKQMQEIQTQKELKAKEAQELLDKQKETQNKETSQTRKTLQSKIKDNKSRMIEEFKKKAEDRKLSEVRGQEEQKKKQELDKKKQQQKLQMYSESNQKQKEQSNKMKQDFYSFLDSPIIQSLFLAYNPAFSAFFDLACKQDQIEAGKLSYNSYLKIGQKHQLFPSLISRQDYIYIYKTILRAKKNTNNNNQEFSNTDIEGTKLNIQDFKECIIKIACLAKFKLGGLLGTEEEIRLKEEQIKNKQKIVNSINLQKSIQKNTGDIVSNDLSNLTIANPQPKLQIGLLEREFDVSDMTEATIENLFLMLGLKPDKNAKKNTLKDMRESVISQAVQEIEAGVEDNEPGRPEIGENQLNQNEADRNEDQVLQ